jgi:aldose sugar dehydrogenase
MRHWPALCLALAVAPAQVGHAVPSARDGNHVITLVADEFTRPTAMAFIGPDEFLVLEKNNGQVHHVVGGVRMPNPVHDFHVTNNGERGLLGIAVHPQFGQGAGKDWVYFYYTASPAMADVNSGTPDNQIDRFTWDGDDLVDQTPIFTLPSDDPNHNGGVLAFGPDGKLYAVIGDVDVNGQLQNNTSAGPPAEITGSVVRLNEDGSVPTDNPLDEDDDGEDLLDAVFAYGIRNSFGLGFDPDGGRLWDTENGPGSFDEINLVAPGFNSGWDPDTDFMGPAPNPPPDFVELPGSAYADPAYSAEEVFAPTAVAFTTSDTSLGADYVEDLFIGDYINGQIYRFELNGGRTELDVSDPVANSQGELEQHLFASGFDGGVTDLKEGPDGALYVVVHASSGAVFKIEGEGGPVAHDVAVTAVKAPKRITIRGATPTTRTLNVTVANAGTATETIANLTELGDLVALDATALSLACPTPPTPALLPPKKPFPLVLPPRKKLKVAYSVAFECASETEDEVELEWDATLDLMGAVGQEDTNAANDVCPRAASGDDRGCGKPAGSPIRTDVIQK